MEMVAIASSDDNVDLRKKDREVKLPASNPWVKGLINHQYQGVYRKKETLRILRMVMGSRRSSNRHPIDKLSSAALRQAQGRQDMTQNRIGRMMIDYRGCVCCSRLPMR
jgi:hypothetical protein